MQNHALTLGGVSRTAWSSTSNPTADPAAQDDTHPIGTVWVNETSNAIFVCVDATIGAAQWQLIYDPANPPGTGGGDGDFKADGTVAMTGAINADGNDINGANEVNADQVNATTSMTLNGVKINSWAEILQNVGPFGDISMGDYTDGPGGE